MAEPIGQEAMPQAFAHYFWSSLQTSSLQMTSNFPTDHFLQTTSLNINKKALTNECAKAN